MKTSFFNSRITVLSPLVVATLIVTVGSPVFKAQSQSKPAASGVRSAAPAQVPAQSVITERSKKLYWVGRASSGGYMGVWLDHGQAQVRTIRFFANKDGLTVVVTKKDEAGNPVASEFNFAASSPQPTGRGNRLGIGFTTVVGPNANPSALSPEPLLPAKLPKGLEADLRRIGADLDTLSKLKSLLEGLTADQRILGAALGQNPGSDYGFPKGSSGPQEKIPASPGAKYGRDGRASGDEPAHVGGVPVRAANGQGAPKAETAEPGYAHAVESDITEEDRQAAELDATYRTPQTSLRPDKGQGHGSEPDDNYYRQTSYSVRTDDGVTDTITRYDTDLHGNILRERVLLKLHSIHEFRQEDLPDPARNPSEGGQHYGGIGIDSQAWGFLRGTGLASLLWNNWVAKTKHDFLAPLRQPGRDDQVGRPVREVPRVGRTAVVNPTEGGGRSGARPKLPGKELIQPTIPGGNPETSGGPSIPGRP